MLFRSGKHQRESKAGALQKGETHSYSERTGVKPNTTGERGESNGNRRDVLFVRGTRRDAVTETIKVIAIKMSEFQTIKTNRLKSAIDF